MVAVQQWDGRVLPDAQLLRAVQQLESAPKAGPGQMALQQALLLQRAPPRSGEATRAQGAECKAPCSAPCIELVVLGT